MFTTRRPPPDPLDAGEEALALLRDANREFRDADDFEEENTGRFDIPAPVPSIHVHLDDDRAGRVSRVDIPARLPKSANAMKTALALGGALVTGILAALHALGWL